MKDSYNEIMKTLSQALMLFRDCFFYIQLPIVQFPKDDYKSCLL